MAMIIRLNQKMRIMTKWHLIDSLYSLIVGEMEYAVANFGSFHNAHEGYAVLLEEVDELWDEIKKNQNTPDRLKNIKKEALQVATMAIRLIHDCCSEENQ